MIHTLSLYIYIYTIYIYIYNVYTINTYYFIIFHAGEKSDDDIDVNMMDAVEAEEDEQVEYDDPYAMGAGIIQCFLMVLC